MEIHNNYIDWTIIILYEFIKFTYPLWYNFILILFNIISLKIKKIIYIPVNKNLNLQKVLLLYDDNIILYNTINLNYYNIKTEINNKKIHIVGNNEYVIINYSFYKLLNQINYLKTYHNQIKIYKLPIKTYNQDECCVCYTRLGSLVGLCGHQNICTNCINKLSKCPMCNNNMLFNKLNSNITNFIFSAT
jgi:hypothetical protein